MFPKVNRDSYGTLPIETDDLAIQPAGFPVRKLLYIYSHYIVII